LKNYGIPAALGPAGEKTGRFKGSYDVQQLWNITTGLSQPPLFNLVLAEEIFVMNWVTTFQLFTLARHISRRHRPSIAAVELVATWRGSPAGERYDR